MQPSRLNRRQFLAAAPTAAGVALLPGCAHAAPDPVQALAEAFVRSGVTSGVSIAVIRGGATRVCNAGVAVRAGGIPASEHMVYEIGSITKTFTSLILAHAVREGRAQLDDDVRKYLGPGYDNLVRAGRPVRLVDLLTTTSALPDNVPAWNSFLVNVPPAQVPFTIAKQLAGQSKAGFLAALKMAELVDVPGHEPRHSNTASQIQGLIVEQLYDQPYTALLGRFIEKPLGMRPGGGAVPPALLATGYALDGTVMPRLDMPVILAAGGLRYSASDMARYIAAQLAAKDPAIAFAQQPRFTLSDDIAIGCHWIIGKSADSQTFLRHSGGTLGFSSYCDFYPAQGYGVVVLSNSGGAQSDCQRVGDAVREAVFGTPRGLAALQSELTRTGYADVAGTIAAVKARFPELHLDIDRVNNWGYRLLRAERNPKAAVAMFAWNVARHPDDWNAHDSLGEALAATGDKAAAIAEYKRSLELNPANAGGAQMIAKLEGRN